MSQCFLLLGTNIGDKKQNLLQARDLIAVYAKAKIQSSSIYQTSAWGKEDQDDFLNQVLMIDTAVQPEELLSICLGIEKEMGRVRYERWGERLIDIDILYYADLMLENEALKVPHAEIQNRRFTLIPLVEIAPDYMHPKLKKSNEQLLDECIDPLEVIKIE